MTTLEEHAQEYLYTLNSITRKIHQDIQILQKNHNEDWDELDFEKQEVLLDNFFVDEAVKQKYSLDSTDNENDVTCFPKHTVNCGEKIVIDFDNDGWTWRDEHSGPFSWMTRSQQDLTVLEDEEDEGIEKDKKAEIKRKRVQKSKSPERPDQSVDLAFKPEKSIWESPFLAADRGLDSAYPSSHASDQSRTSDESDDLSQKLAASLSVSIDEDVVDSQLNSPNNNDTSVLLDSGNQKTIDLASVRLERSRKGSGSSEDSSSITSKGSQGKRKKDGGLVTKLWNPAKKDRTADSGQISPVYLEEPGESSSDFTTISPSTEHSTTFTFSPSAREECIAEEEAPRATLQVSGQVNEGLDDSFRSSEKDDQDEWKNDLVESTSPTSDLKKTGFDFLDNW